MPRTLPPRERSLGNVILSRGGTWAEGGRNAYLCVGAPVSEEAGRDAQDLVLSPGDARGVEKEEEERF